MLRCVFASLFLVSIAAPAAADAVLGERQAIVDHPLAAIRDSNQQAKLRVTYWYAAEPEAAGRPADIGSPGSPLFMLGHSAPDAAPAERHRRPVILLSHGFGGSARMMGWFARGMVDRGYVVVGVDHPGNNGLDTMTMRGAVMWADRVEDLGAALRSAMADPVVGPLIDADRVGVAGFSIGGLTALAAAGARVSSDNLKAFCAQTPADGVCRPQAEYPVSIERLLAVLDDPGVADYRERERAERMLPNVRAAFAMAPVIQALAPESLAAVRVPVAIVSGDADMVVPPATHAVAAASLIPDVSLHLTPGAGHYSYLAQCSAAARESVALCRQATEQAAAHADAVSMAAAHFAKAFARQPVETAARRTPNRP